MHRHHKIYLEKLYPFLNKHDGTIDEEFIEFPHVQAQPNGRDCGVFAIAFAVSLLFKILPDKVTYTHALMRQHLIHMFQSNRIEHFPCTQDQQLTRCVHEYESAISSTINKNPSCGNDPAFQIGKSYITNETDNTISPVQNVVLSDKEVTIYTKNVIQTDPPLVSKSKISNVYLPSNRTEYMSNYYKRQKEEINLKRRAVYKAKKGECNMKKMHYDANQEAICKKRKNYYQQNKEGIIKKKKMHYDANKEVTCEKRKKYYQQNKEGIIKKNKMHYDANKEVKCGKGKNYYQQNKEIISKKRKAYNEIRKEDNYNKVAQRRAVLKIIKKYRNIAVTNNNIGTKNNKETYIRKL